MPEDLDKTPERGFSKTSTSNSSQRHVASIPKSPEETQIRGRNRCNSGRSETESKSRSSIKGKLINLAHETGLIRAGRSLWAKSLTVVNYHRIDDPHRKDFNLLSQTLVPHLKISMNKWITWQSGSMLSP